jgi:hypothetical protein
MSRNDSAPPHGYWALMVAVSGWLVPMAVYYLLLWMFRADEVWAQVGPYLLIAFALLSLFAEVSALFMAAIAWPAKSAKGAIAVALVLLILNSVMLAQGLRQIQ